jgi:hypothetical protein
MTLHRCTAARVPPVTTRTGVEQVGYGTGLNPPSEGADEQSRICRFSKQINNNQPFSTIRNEGPRVLDTLQRSLWMPQDDSLLSSQRDPINVVVQRHCQIALLPTPSIPVLPSQKRLECASPSDASRLIVPLDHAPHIADPSLTLFTYIHLPADLAPLAWILTSDSV